MTRRIIGREWDASHAAQSLRSARFAITPLGREALRQANAGRTDEAQARPEPSAVAPCIWCRQPIRPGEAFTLIGGEPMHEAPCRREFDEMTTAEGQES